MRFQLLFTAALSVSSVAAQTKGSPAAAQPKGPPGKINGNPKPFPGKGNDPVSAGIAVQTKPSSANVNAAVSAAVAIQPKPTTPTAPKGNTGVNAGATVQDKPSPGKGNAGIDAGANVQDKPSPGKDNDVQAKPSSANVNAAVSAAVAIQPKPTAPTAPKGNTGVNAGATAQDKPSPGKGNAGIDAGIAAQVKSFPGKGDGPAKTTLAIVPIIAKPSPTSVDIVAEGLVNNTIAAITAAPVTPQIDPRDIVNRINEDKDVVLTALKNAQLLEKGLNTNFVGPALVEGLQTISNRLTTSTFLLGASAGIQVDASDQANICTAYQEFASIHQLLINELVSHKNVLKGSTYGGKLGTLLRYVQVAIDNFSKNVIGFVPTCKQGVQTNLSGLDQVVKNALAIYA